MPGVVDVGVLCMRSRGGVILVIYGVRVYSMVHGLVLAMFAGSAWSAAGRRRHVRGVLFALFVGMVLCFARAGLLMVMLVVSRWAAFPSWLAFFVFDGMTGVMPVRGFLIVTIIIHDDPPSLTSLTGKCGEFRW